MMKINIRIKVPTFVTCIILYIPALLFAEDKLQTTNLTDPAALMEAIAKIGPQAVVNDLYENTSDWNALLQHVATGDAAWLRVASALHPGTDAGSDEELTLAVGEALENAPENVLKISIKEFRLEDVCSGPDSSDRYNSFNLAINALNKRQREVGKITDPKLIGLVKRCIQALEESKEALKEAYDVNNGDIK